MDRLSIQEWRPILFEKEAPAFPFCAQNRRNRRWALSFERGFAQMEKAPSELDLKTAEDPYSWTGNVLFLL